MVWFKILEEIWFQHECYRFAPNSKFESDTRSCIVDILEGLWDHHSPSSIAVNGFVASYGANIEVDLSYIT